MADLNKVFLMGRLTFDPELRRTAGGIAVSDLRLATSRSWTGKDGERKEETLFIDVTRSGIARPRTAASTSARAAACTSKAR